ncbi:hypothetical protein TCAL_07499 [Tigriopus californicus]|uniref:AMP-dependent synthetase/ligase domain-containing protein n=1 Tax=Tigriopus californicus TaxID=6832 RepID=A0A553PCE3_TIGCA|nr:luciferin 4-monooxygenase-like [Tigriopus californicus]TRY75330.1 hypothetical protein TCAL_07499 [Tigriopus californicus]
MSIIQNRVLYGEKPFTPICVPRERDTLIRHVLEAVRRISAEEPDRKWITDVLDFANPRTRYIRDIEPMSIKFAQALVARGVQPGDVVQLYLENNVDYFLIIFAGWLCGARVSTCDPTIKGKGIQQQLKDAQPKVVFCCDSTIEKVAASWSGMVSFNPNNLILWSDEMCQSFLATPDMSLPILDNSVDDTAIILWSSGTTGVPKGIEWTHRGLMNLMDPVDFPPSTLYATTMFYHIGGFNIPMSCCIFGNFHAIFHGSNYDVQSEDIYKVVDQYQAKLLLLGSHHAIRLASDRPNLNYDLSSVLAISPLGSAVPTTIGQELKMSFPNCDMILWYYGLTETGAVTNNVDNTSLGPLRDGRMVRIVNPETNQLLGAYEHGEIQVKSGCMCAGYFNRPDLTRAAFTEDGYFRTGDLGSYDENGLLYFHDRIKDLIKYKNMHVYPADLENIIQSHQDIVEVAIYGKPNLLTQETISALVVLKKGSNLSGEEIREMVNSQVEDFKKIRGAINFVDILPRNFQGKVLRKLLPAMF